MLLMVLLEVIFGIFALPFRGAKLLTKVLVAIGLWLYSSAHRSVRISHTFQKGRKIGKGIVSVLNFGAFLYSIFIIIEPILDKRKA